MQRAGGFCRRAGFTDEFDPGSAPGGIDLAADEEALDVGRGDTWIDGLHNGIEAGFLSVDLFGMGGDIFQPRTG